MLSVTMWYVDSHLVCCQSPGMWYVVSHTLYIVRYIVSHVVLFASHCGWYIVSQVVSVSYVVCCQSCGTSGTLSVIVNHLVHS